MPFFLVPIFIVLAVQLSVGVALLVDGVRRVLQNRRSNRGLHV